MNSNHCLQVTFSFTHSKIQLQNTESALVSACETTIGINHQLLLLLFSPCIAKSAAIKKIKVVVCKSEKSCVSGICVLYI